MCSLRALRGLHSTMPGFRALAKFPPETVCLADWHLSRLYLQQPLEKKEKGSDYHEEYTQFINQREGRETDREGVWVSVALLLVLSNLCTQAHECLQSNKCTHTQKHILVFF